MSRLISYVIAGLIALAILSSTLFVVDQRQFAIVFALGEVKQVIKDPGLHFKLPPLRWRRSRRPTLGQHARHGDYGRRCSIVPTHRWVRRP